MSSDLTAARVARAAHIPALLAAAYDAFEYMLLALRAAEGHAGALLPAFAMSAAAAANGRDAIASAPSLPPGAPPGPAALEAAAAADPGALADDLAGLGLMLSERLAAAPAAPADRTACADGAAHARRIHWLLAAPA